jgi:hypothetical protein
VYERDKRMINEDKFIEIIRKSTKTIGEAIVSKFKIREKETNALVYCAYLNFIPPIGSIIKLPKYAEENGQKYIVDSIFINYNENSDAEPEIIVSTYDGSI